MKTLHLSIIGLGIIASAVVLFQISLEQYITNPHLPIQPTITCEALYNLEKGLMDIQIDKSQAIALSKNDPEFISKTKGFLIESQEVGESVSYNVRYCNNFQVENVNVAFLLQNGTDTHEIVV